MLKGVYLLDPVEPLRRRLTVSARLRATVALLAAALVMLACARKSSDELFTEGERASHNTGMYPKAENLLREFVDRYPDDGRLGMALIILARILQNQERPREAIAAYERLLERVPNSDKADEAQFMIGFIYDSLKDYEKARAAYQKIIEAYPHSQFVDDAQVSLEYLGRPPEELLKRADAETVATNK